MKFYELKVQLQHIKKPPVWRKIRVSPKMNLGDLHFAIQNAMGWFNYHLHHFMIREGGSRFTFIGPPMDEGMSFGPPTLNENKYTIDQFLQKPKDYIDYEYDFGDGWLHRITLQKIVEGDANTPAPYLLKAKGTCPPEDCGGPGGYEYLKEVMANPKKYKEDYENFSEWLLADEWDPKEEIDIEDINGSF